MALVLNDDIRCVKLILLLVKGGTFVAKRIILNNLDKNIDDFLKDNEDELKRARKKRHITEKQIDILFPGTRTNFECWDISLYSYILLNLFGDKLEIDEKTAIIELRENRNKLAHSGSSILSEVQFSGEWTHLTLVLLQLARKLTSAERKEINVIVFEISTIQDFRFATNELKSFEGSDEFVHSTITEMWKSVDQKLKDIFRRLDNLEDKDTRERPQEITARMTANASTPLKRDAAQAELLNATQRCVSRKQNHSDERYQYQTGDDEVLAASNNLFSDMRDQGVDIVKVEKGSILVTFRCSTISALINISKYLADGMYEERLAELENALSRYIESPVKLDINIVIETLYSALKQIEEDANNKSIVLTLQCKGSEGVKNAIDCFGNGSSTNTLNSLSEALTKYVGQRVELHTTIDVDKLENDITELERQLILGDQNIVHELPKRMETSLKLSTTELLPDETAPTEYSPRSKHIEVPMGAWTKPSSSYSSYKSPQLSKDSHQATLYRQQSFAVRHNLPTGLAFEPDMCKVHTCSKLPALTERFVHIRSWLEGNDLSSECELLTSQRTTLKEIESCCLKSDAWHGAFPPTMKLSALPCGCIEDGRTGYCITVDDLWATGCVTDMTYKVCTGELKNGLVLVPALGSYFRKTSNVFQMSVVAIAAKQMKDKLNMERILIFQWNASDGMSTQKATYDDKAILYISILETKKLHHYQKYWKSRECGSRNAEGFNINIAMDEFAGDAEYLEAFRTIAMPIAREFNPEIVLFSGGFYDAPRWHEDHDLSPCGLSPECVSHMTSELMSLANGKVVLIAEVGYGYLPERDSAVIMCLKALLGKEITPSKDKLQNLPNTRTLHDLERTIRIQLEYWPCLRSHLSTTHSLLSEAQQKENIRQGLAAVSYTFRTALSFNTETCTKHSRRSEYTKASDRISSWLDGNNLILNCKLLKSPRATLQEIEAFRSRRKPSMELLYKLPCGCIEDGRTGKYIPVDVLRAAGCVTDMAYKVGTGELKNGLVFVPASERFFRKDSDVFQLSFAAIAAKQVKEILNMKRILIFQLNGSYGLSTQRATYDDEIILYISIHANSAMDLYQNHGQSHECGYQNAEGFNINIPLDTPAGDVEYLAAFRNIVMPIAHEFDPEIVLVSERVDQQERIRSCRADIMDIWNTGYLKQRELLRECFSQMTRELMSLANGKVVLLAEVGYGSLLELESAEMCLKALLGKEGTSIKEDQLQKLPSTHALQDLKRTIQIQLKYWPCLQKHLSEIQNLLADDMEGGKCLSALHIDEYKIRERGRVSSLLGSKLKPIMVSSTDKRTTHDVSDKKNPIVLKMKNEETSSVKNYCEIL